MDNENKELDLESQDVEVNADEVEFDPTESEEFYNNLEAAIGNDVPDEVKAADAVITEDVLSGVQEENVPQESPVEDDELFAGVNAALAEQIEQEFGKNTEISSAEEESENKFLAVWKAIPRWTKVLAAVILAVLISVGLLFGTEGGRSIVYKVVVGIIMGEVKKDPAETPTPSPEATITISPELTVTITPEPTVDPVQNPDSTPAPSGEPTPEPTEEPDATPEPTETPEPTATPKPVVKIMDDEDIINVLLLGEENIYGSKRGRTDSIIVVSINLNGGPIKMVSFLRDLYVAVPGYPDNRLNASYGKGGARLIMETIENNFGIDIDAYVKVDFEGFESIIDNLGGLRFSLTARESEYLNTTKYISKPEERNTVAGEQTLTGAQVLGYCRVRHVPTAEGLRDDWGRNARQRAVLQAIFEQYKSKNITELASVMRDCFNYVTVSSNLEDYAVECLQAVVENRMFEIETMQMPQKGKYTDITVRIEGDDAKVIVAHPESIEKLQEFLYGE